MDVPRLSSYPYVVVRVVCLTCRRLGSYLLAQLAARFGPEAPLTEVLAALAGDCPGRIIKRYTGSYPVCVATLPVLRTRRHPTCRRP